MDQGKKRSYFGISPKPESQEQVDNSLNKRTAYRPLGSRSVNLPLSNLSGKESFKKQTDEKSNARASKTVSYNIVPTLQRTADDIDNQVDQVYWSSSRKTISPIRSSLQTNVMSQNLMVNENTEIDVTNLPNLKVDPISTLEKKYKTNFALSSLTPSGKQKKLQGFIKKSDSLKFGMSNSYTNAPAAKSPLSKKSKSLSLNHSKLFSRKNSEKNNMTGSNVEGPKNSLKEILSELQNKTEQDNNLGNTTSELLDRGININDYQRDDFNDDFFDESLNTSLVEPTILPNSLSNTKNTQVPNKITQKNTVSPSKSSEFDDEFSSDDDFAFDELQKKIDQKTISMTLDNKNILQSTPSKSAPEAKALSRFDSSDSSDFSVDEEAEEELFTKLSQKKVATQLTQRKFSTQQMTKIKETDLAGAAIFLKDIHDNVEDQEDKDSFADVNLAKIALHRSWLHRFQITEVHEKTYTFKGAKKNQIILRVTDKDGHKRNIVVRDSWIFTKYEAGEIVHIIGHNPTIVDNETNFLILNPDTLLSATTIGESLNCERKSALLARYKLPGESSKALIVGNIIHETLQKCMINKDATMSFVQDLVAKCIDEFMIDILSINESRESIKAECEKHLGYVTTWVQTFIRGNRNRTNGAYIKTFGEKKDTRFVVDKVLDIEESIWSPVFGLRGLIDATIQAFIQDEGHSGKFVFPLEIKTGKEYLSHQAQTSLYTLLMKDRYELDIDFFILVYTKFFQTTKHNIDKKDLRMLLIKRNQVSKFLKQIQPELPPLVKNSVCDRCLVKDVCMTYNKLVENGSEETSGFKPGEFTEATEHINDSRYSEFYKHWEDLLNKEENFISKLTKEIWIFTGEERENANGKSICNLKIKEVSYDPQSLYYTYVFNRKSETKKYSPMTWSQLSRHDHIIVSDERGHFAICFGFVVLIREDFIKITTKRRLDHSNLKSTNFNSTNNQNFYSVLDNEQKEAPSELRFYRIDKNPAFHGLQLARYNLLDMFSRHGNKRIRDILVSGTRIPPFKTPIIDLPASSKFNIDQIAAMNKCFSINDFALILGMPGTGKTTVITEIIKRLVLANKTVLVASYTHSAIDNILVKLKNEEMTDFVRLGSINKIHPEIQKFSPLSSEINSAEDLNKAYIKPSVVATTCLGITEWVFNHRVFDYCIIDEASQVSMPICLGPLRFAEKFILVGDHYQLPPLVVAPSARKGLQVSLFKHLSDTFPDSVVELTHQYRMCDDIMMLSNTLIYNGRLKCGTKQVAERFLDIPNPKEIKKHMVHDQIGNSESAWLDVILKRQNKVVFLNHDSILTAKERMSGDKIDNPVEADLIYQIVEGLIATGISESSIGVMSLYRAQIRLLNIILKLRKNVQVLTADRFQGLDKDCIIISLVRSNDKQLTGELLREWRRINVAITRAKTKLIILGSKRTLQNLPTINAFLNILESRGWLYNLPSNALKCYEFFSQPFSTALQFPVVSARKQNENDTFTSSSSSSSSSPSRITSLRNTKISQRLVDNHLLLKNILDDN